MVIDAKQIHKLARAYATKKHEWAALDKNSLVIINTSKSKTAAIRYAKQHGNGCLYNLNTFTMYDDLSVGLPSSGAMMTQVYNLPMTTSTTICVDSLRALFTFNYSHAGNYIAVVRNTCTPEAIIPFRANASLQSIRLTIYKWLREKKYEWSV